MPGLSPKAFDFVAGVLAEVESKGPEGELTSRSAVITLAETVFEQTFAEMEIKISGTGRAAKARAGKLLEDPAKHLTAEARKLLTVFEKFCDLSTDVEGNYGGSPVPLSAGVEVLDRLLRAVGEWAEAQPDGSIDPELLARIEGARTEVGAWT